MIKNSHQCPALQSLCEKYLLRTRPTKLLEFAVQRKYTALASRVLNVLFQNIPQLIRPTGNAKLDNLKIAYLNMRCHGITYVDDNHQIVKASMSAVTPDLALVINSLDIRDLAFEKGYTINLNALFPILASCRRVHTLRLEHVGPDAIKGLTAVLPKTGLRTLRMKILDVQKQDIFQFAKALARTTTLTNLNLFGSQLSSSLFSSAFKDATSIRCLDLGCTGINNAPLLLHCPLRELNLSGNTVEAKALAGALKTNTFLNSLSLSSCRLLPGAITSFAAGLAKNNTLKKLDLSGNLVGTTGGAQAFANLLQVNRSLHILKLDNINLCNMGVQMLSQGLKSNQCLKRLSLSFNAINDGGFKLLIDTLSTNVLIDLDVSDNKVTNQGSSYLPSILSPLKRFITINLQNNRNIDYYGKRYVEEHLYKTGHSVFL